MRKEKVKQLWIQVKSQQQSNYHSDEILTCKILENLNIDVIFLTIQIISLGMEGSFFFFCK